MQLRTCLQRFDLGNEALFQHLIKTRLDTFM